MTHRGPFQPLTFCDSVELARHPQQLRAASPRCGLQLSLFPLTRTPLGLPDFKDNTSVACS